MTILKFLQLGGSIKFPSGYILEGDPKNSYINCKVEIDGNIVPDGIRLLNKDGLKDGFKDANGYEMNLVLNG